MLHTFLVFTMHKEAFYHEGKDMFCEEILMCMGWYIAMENSLIQHEHQQSSAFVDLSYISELSSCL